MYPRPFFISPHALQQFRKRFSPEYSDQEIQQLLNDQLQPPKIPDAVHINMKRGEPALYYGIIVDSIPSTAVVVAPPGADITIRRRPDEWPVVATLYPGRFQSTHPCGVRQDRYGWRFYNRCFNPRTPAGCDGCSVKCPAG